MSYPFGNGKNPYQTGARDDFFVKSGSKFNFEVKKTVDEVSLFDITSENDLNDTGSQLAFKDIFEDVPPEFDGPKWLGLTGKGSFGSETPIMKTTYLKSPPNQTDETSSKKDDTDSDSSWNTFA